MAEHVRKVLGPVPPLPEPPPISIVMLNLNGQRHLERVVPLLATATDYPTIELIVVDNGSDDGSLAYLDSAPVPYSISVEANAKNVSFSEGCNQGAALARFDLLLFLNNDVEPFEPGWLRELVICMQRSRSAAVGATLLHGAARPGSVESGYLIQHQGVRFRRKEGYATPINRLDANAGLERVGRDVPSPAVTAACMLIERSTFEQVGGFSPGFHYGYEDVDLGLKLVAAGATPLCSGRSLLFHHESSTRLTRLEGPDRRRTRLANQRLLMTRWGPQLERQYMCDRLQRAGLWSERARPEVAITAEPDWKGDQAARELGDALERCEWDVAYVERVGDAWGELPDGTDLLVVTDPGYGVSLPRGVTVAAWVLGDPEQWLRRPWLRQIHLLLAGDSSGAETLQSAGRHVVPFAADGDWETRASELSELVEQRSRRLRFCLKLPRPRARGSLEVTTLACELRRELERRGHLCMLESADEWDRLEGLTADVVIGLGARYVPRPAQLNVLWLDAPPDADTLSGSWDLIAVDSGPLADRLRTLPATAPLMSPGWEQGSAGAGRVIDRLLQALNDAAATTAFELSIVSEEA